MLAGTTGSSNTAFMAPGLPTRVSQYDLSARRGGAGFEMRDTWTSAGMRAIPCTAYLRERLYPGGC